MRFETMPLPEDVTVTAPDGSDVRVLLAVRGASMAHFELGPGRTSAAVRHRTVDEVWFVVAGTGEMWRRQGERETVESLRSGTCLTIPVGTEFQFRCQGEEPLQAVAATSPCWPGEDEAVAVTGPWTTS